MKTIEKQYPFNATDIMVLMNITDESKVPFIEDLIIQACDLIENITGYSVTNEVIEVSQEEDGNVIKLTKVPDKYDVSKIDKLSALDYALLDEKAQFEFYTKDYLKPFVIEYIHRILNSENIDDLVQKLNIFKLRRI